MTAEDRTSRQVLSQKTENVAEIFTSGGWDGSESLGKGMSVKLTLLSRLKRLTVSICSLSNGAPPQNELGTLPCRLALLPPLFCAESRKC